MLAPQGPQKSTKARQSGSSDWPECGKLEPRNPVTYRGRIRIKITSKIKISDKADSKLNVPESQRDDGQDQKQAAGHELLRFGEAHAEDDEEHGHYYIDQDARDAWFEQAAGAQDQDGCRDGGGDERGLAFGFEKTNQAADEQQYDIYPKDGLRCHCQESASAGLHVQAQNLAGFALDDDIEGSAANLAVGSKALAADAGVDGELEGLPAIWATDGFGDLHATVRG